MGLYNLSIIVSPTHTISVTVFKWHHLNYYVTYERQQICSVTYFNAVDSTIYPQVPTKLLPPCGNLYVNQHTDSIIVILKQHIPNVILNIDALKSFSDEPNGTNVLNAMHEQIEWNYIVEKHSKICWLLRKRVIVSLKVWTKNQYTFKIKYF